MDASIERRLTTLLFADVVGYSRLMGQDEAGTLATLRSCRDAIAERVADSRGRVVNTAGDNVLAEFASVVKAVECAITVQRELAERNAGLAAERQMWFRIGINLGDVMVEGDDLYGDGVNVAARLQALAEPGGILISGTVFEHVKDKLAVAFDFIGPQSVKNIAAQVPAYRVLLQPDPAAASPPDSIPSPAPPAAEAATGARQALRHRFYISAARAGAVILLLAAINLFTWDGELWVHWPALAILFLFALRWLHAFRPRGE
jgi:class 3 adenylate cyclase